MRRSCELLAVTLLLVLPATARAESRTRTSGATTATITWTVDDGLPKDLRVTITRAGTQLVDAAIQAEEPEPALGPLGDDPLRVRDLTGDGEPEVLVDAYTGGAHCCDNTTAFWFTGSGYQSARHDWGNSFYRLGGGLLVGSDDRFDYAFTAYAFSREPVLVLDAHLDDVTAQHPRIVQRDLRHHRHLYTQGRGRYDIRAPLAAYVADLHSLGRHAQANRVLQSALRHHWLRKFSRYNFGPGGRGYIRLLNKMLREGGYISRKSARAA